MTGPEQGLQAERTSLAWQRTGVASSVVAGSALIAAAHLGRPGLVLAAAAVAAVSALAVGMAAAHRAPGSGPGPDPGSDPRAGAGGSPWRRLLAVAAVPLLLAPVGVLLALITG